jgi:hypothetical protein
VDAEAMDRIGELLAEADHKGRAVIELKFAAIVRQADYADERLVLSIDKVELTRSGDPQEPRFTNAKEEVEKVDYVRPLVLVSDGAFQSIAPAALGGYVRSAGAFDHAFQFYQSGTLTIIAEIYQG